MTSDNDNFPQTLLEAVRYFSNPQVAHDFMVQLRWGSRPVCCPRCGCDKTSFISTRRTWECKSETPHPQHQFSVKTGTIMEESPLSLDKWLATIWLIANAKNGISSYEIHRALGVTQKTGWFMLHRIRLAMRTGTFEKLKGDAFRKFQALASAIMKVPNAEVKAQMKRAAQLKSWKKKS